MKSSNLSIDAFALFFMLLTINCDSSCGFITASTTLRISDAHGLDSSIRIATHLDMVATTASSSGNFFDDFNNPRRREDSGGGSGSDDSSSSSSSSFSSSHIQHDLSSDGSSKFVAGDDLHRLRHQILGMRLELQDARQNADVGSVEMSRRVQELEQAIMKAQQVDAEFVYTVSLERQELAKQRGNMIDAQRYHERAMNARSALPQFNLEGLWVGKYGEDQGYEMINVTYCGDTLLAHKVTSGTKHVPKGANTFQVDLSPHLLAEEQQLQQHETSNGNDEYSIGQQRSQQQPHAVLSPIELGDSAAKQWGCKYLQRFAGIGQVASENYQDSQWMDGQLILVNEYFSFAWLPIGHQVFFGRPTPELIVKLMKNERKKEISGRYGAGEEINNLPARLFLEKCWEETEHIIDDMEIEISSSSADDSSRTATPRDNINYYDYQEGCFE